MRGLGGKPSTHAPKPKRKQTTQHVFIRFAFSSFLHVNANMKPQSTTDYLNVVTSESELITETCASFLRAQHKFL